VREGALAVNGMISFVPWLSEEQVGAIRGVVLSEARRSGQVESGAGAGGGR